MALIKKFTAEDLAANTAKRERIHAVRQGIAEMPVGTGTDTKKPKARAKKSEPTE